MSTRKKVFYGISTDYLGTALVAVVSFAVVPFYFRYVSAAEYGVWLAIQGVVGMLTIAEFGGDVYLTTKIADDSVFSDQGAAVAQVSTMVFLKILLSLIFAVSGAVVYFFLGSLVPGAADPGVLKAMFLISLAVLIINLYFSTISTILSARHHYSLVNSSFSAMSVLSALLALAFLALGMGIPAFPLALLAATILQSCFLLWQLRRRYPFLRFRAESVSRESIRATYRYSKNFYLLRLAAMIRTNYLVLAISALTSTAFVTVYNITNRVPSTIPMFFSKVSMGLFPSFAGFYASGNLSRIKDVYLRLSKLVWRFAILSAILVAAFNGEFVRLWVGADKYAGAVPMAFICAGMFLVLVNSPLGTIVYASGKYGRWPRWAVVEIVLSISLSYWFSSFWGFTGIIAGFVISSLVTSIYLWGLVNRILGITPSEFLRNTAAYALVPNLSTLFLAVVVRNLAFGGWEYLCGALLVLLTLHVTLFEGVQVLRSKESGLKKKIAGVLPI